VIPHQHQRAELLAAPPPADEQDDGPDYVPEDSTDAPPDR